MAYDLDVAPEHLRCVTRAERFHRRLFRGEAPGKVNGRTMTPGAVSDLPISEDALDEAVTPLLDDVLNAIDVGRIETESDDIGHDVLMILPPPESFAWTDHAGQPALVCTPLAEVARHFWTTRAWPLGRPTAERTDEQPWRVVAEAAGVAIDRLIRVRQVHGVSIAVGAPLAGLSPAAADIVMARDATLACAIQVADCVPLLIADRKTGAVAAVHCGWRGISLNAARVAVDALAREWGSRPADLIAAVGPSIGACCYEVGLDVRQRFAEAGVANEALARWFLPEPATSDRNPSMHGVRDRQASRPNHWFFDGWGAVVEQLVSASVAHDQIFAARLCTASHPDLFCSYRGDKGTAGRLAGVIRSPLLRP
jgi:YfiH family protein